MDLPHFTVEYLDNGRKVKIEFDKDVPESLVSALMRTLGLMWLESTSLTSTNLSLAIVRGMIIHTMMNMVYRQVLRRNLEGMWEYTPMNKPVIVSHIKLDTGTSHFATLEEVMIEQAPSGFYIVKYLWSEEKHDGMVNQWYIGGCYLNPLAAAAEAAMKIFRDNIDDTQVWVANQQAIDKYKESIIYS